MSWTHHYLVRAEGPSGADRVTGILSFTDAEERAQVFMARGGFLSVEILRTHVFLPGQERVLGLQYLEGRWWETFRALGRRRTRPIDPHAWKKRLLHGDPATLGQVSLLDLIVDADSAPDPSSAL